MKSNIFKKCICITLMLLQSIIGMNALGRDFEISNLAEIGLAVAKGPIVSLSYKYKDQYHAKARAIHIAADLMRISCKVLNLINHPKEINSATNFWVVFDVCNVILDLKNKEKDQAYDVDDFIDIYDEQIEQIDDIVKNIQLYVLPGLEVVAATACALTNENTELCRLRRRQARSVESLARAVSVYLNHKKSKSALVLLIAALCEVIYTIESTCSTYMYPKIQQRNDFGTGDYYDDNENDNNGNDQNFDWTFWGDEERERERNREMAERERQQQIQEQHRQELEFQSYFPPELRQEPGGLFVYRNGQRTLNEGIEDPINLGEFEVGDNVQILSCNHGIRQADIPMIQNQNQCPSCNQPRIHNNEVTRIVPNKP